MSSTLGVEEYRRDTSLLDFLVVGLLFFCVASANIEAQD